MKEIHIQNSNSESAQIGSLALPAAEEKSRTTNKEEKEEGGGGEIEKEKVCVVEWHPKLTWQSKDSSCKLGAEENTSPSAAFPLVKHFCVAKIILSPEKEILLSSGIKAKFNTYYAVYRDL